jgi:hypothetical protein
LAVLILAQVWACAGSTLVNPDDGRVANGLWGGEHIALTVTSAGAQVEFDCASGEIVKPLVADSQGRFSIEGVYVQGHPGPIRVDENPESKPARYSGRIDGATMTLDIMLTNSSATIGTFTLTRGGFPRVIRCL